MKPHNPMAKERDSMAMFIPEKGDAVYRLLCPANKIGRIIGKGGQNRQFLQRHTCARIKVCDTIPGANEAQIIIFSPATPNYPNMMRPLCPAQDALLRLHYQILRQYDDEGGDVRKQVSVRLLVGDDQAARLIGRGESVMRSYSGANIRVHPMIDLPPCAEARDNLVQITGSPPGVTKALYEVSARLRQNPSSDPFWLTQNPACRAGKYVSFEVVCSKRRVGAVIGKRGINIEWMRKESGAHIDVLPSADECEDRLVAVWGKECENDEFSPTVNAVLGLQGRASEMKELKIGKWRKILVRTRIVVASRDVDCVLGIKEVGAVINVLEEDNVPKCVAARNDSPRVVEILGDCHEARNALREIVRRLRTKYFQR